MPDDVADELADPLTIPCASLQAGVLSMNFMTAMGVGLNLPFLKWGEKLRRGPYDNLNSSIGTRAIAIEGNSPTCSAILGGCSHRRVWLQGAIHWPTDLPRSF